jgi:hypothetical protein
LKTGLIPEEEVPEVLVGVSWSMIRLRLASNAVSCCMETSLDSGARASATAIRISHKRCRMPAGERVFSVGVRTALINRGGKPSRAVSKTLR